MDFALEAALAENRWPVLYHFPAINEDDEELLLPLEGPLIDGLPYVQNVQDLGLPIQDQGLHPPDQGWFASHVFCHHFFLFSSMSPYK